MVGRDGGRHDVREEEFYSGLCADAARAQSGQRRRRQRAAAARPCGRRVAPATTPARAARRRRLRVSVPASSHACSSLSACHPTGDCPAAQGVALDMPPAGGLRCPIQGQVAQAQGRSRERNGARRLEQPSRRQRSSPRPSVRPSSPLRAPALRPQLRRPLVSDLHRPRTLLRSFADLVAEGACRAPGQPRLRPSLGDNSVSLVSRAEPREPVEGE